MDARDEELDALIERMNGEQSELRLVELLPEAKRLYEELHPETRQGGDRTKQISKKGSWKAFHHWVEGKTGVSQTTVYRRLEQAAALSKLDLAARDAMNGTILSNRIGIALRIAAIPEERTQLVLVQAFAFSGMRKGKVELSKAEASFGTAKAKREKPDPAPTPEPDLGSPSEPGGDASVADLAEGAPATARGDADPQTNELPSIMAALDVMTAGECVPVIDQLKARPTLEAIGSLHAIVHDLMRKNKALEEELAVHRNMPSAKLYSILGAKTVKEALRNAQAMKEASDAAS